MTVVTNKRSIKHPRAVDVIARPPPRPGLPSTGPRLALPTGHRRSRHGPRSPVLIRRLLPNHPRCPSLRRGIDRGLGTTRGIGYPMSDRAQSSHLLHRRAEPNLHHRSRSATPCSKVPHHPEGSQPSKERNSMRIPDPTTRHRMRMGPVARFQVMSWPAPECRPAGRRSQELRR